MKKRFAIVFAAVVIVLFILVLPGWGILAKQNPDPSSTGGFTPLSGQSPTPLPGQTSTQVGSLISRNIPAFSSSSIYPASNANGASYDVSWRSRGAPAWLVYDLSSVPAAQRSKVLVVWYNDASGNYDHTIEHYPGYNLPQDYTIAANAAPGQGPSPAAGWVALVTVQGNHYHSRQHVINMTGYNWIRINVTAIDGSILNEDVSLNMDVYDARTALQDDWIFFGDSITAGGMGHETSDGVPSFAQLINTKVPGHYPVQENGGVAYLTSADGVQYLKTWLSLFPGKYVGLSYGTNEADRCLNPVSFYNNYVAMVQDVLNAGKIPVVPHIPWGKTANIEKCTPGFNAKIDALYAAFPQIIHGPDLWSFFQSHQDMISSGDNFHPNLVGYGGYRQLWADTMLATVYAHVQA